MIKLKGSSQSNSQPVTRRVLIANSQTIFLNSAVKVVDGGLVQSLTTGDTGIAVVANIVEIDGVGSKSPRQDGAGATFSSTQKIVTPSDNETTKKYWVEIYDDPNAVFEADWDVTPTANSLEFGACSDVVTGGLTLVNANSVAMGSAANFKILSTDATKKKSDVRLNLKESCFFA